MSPGATIIPVVPRRSWPRAEGIYFDGRTARAHEVQLSIDDAAQTLCIRAPGLAADWPLAQLRRLPDQAARQGLVLRRADDPLARLLTSDRLLAKRLPALAQRGSDVSRPRLLSWACGALASVALIILVLVPLMADQLAAFIPPEGERALGDSTLAQIRKALSESEPAPLPLCDDPRGRAALSVMQAALERHADLPVPLTVHVLNHSMVNAFALPGGHVIFMRGLIDQARTPEEVAAVFAHEMGHVASRDPTRHALRSAGSIGVLGLLFGDFAGGALVLFLTEQLIEAQYSQQAETAADQFAYGVLQKAAIAPAALGDIFARLAAEHGETDGLAAHFLSHPALSRRIAAARAATPADFQSQPLLSAAQWRALGDICSR